MPWQMTEKPKNNDQLKFGHHFADHMMEVDWSEGQGWTRPIISPVHDLRIHPGAKVSIAILNSKYVNSGASLRDSTVRGHEGVQGR